MMMNQPQSQPQSLEENNNSFPAEESQDYLNDSAMEEHEEEDQVRAADKVYCDKLLAVPTNPFEILDANILRQIENAEDDMMVDSILDSYFLKLEAKKAEMKIEMAMNAFQHEETLRKIREQMELEKLEAAKEAMRKGREEQIQPLLVWLKRNIRFVSAENEKEIFETIRVELEEFVSNKTFLSYDCYSELNERTKNKYQSILDEITDFPAEDDEEYQYDDC